MVQGRQIAIRARMSCLPSVGMSTKDDSGNMSNYWGKVLRATACHD